MQFFSQRDPKYAGHPLGWGPKDGTIGEFGCYNCVCAMIAWACGLHYTPVMFDVLATALKVFVRDSTGTYDFLPDNALDVVFPGRFKTVAYSGFRADLITAAIRAKNQYAYLHISTASVPTHYVWALGLNAIADPWWGRVGALAGYGGPGAVVRTHIVEFIPPPVVVKPKPPVVKAPPVLTAPPVVILPVSTPTTTDPLPAGPIALPTPPAAVQRSFQDILVALLFWLRSLVRA